MRGIEVYIFLPDKDVTTWEEESDLARLLGGWTGSIRGVRLLLTLRDYFESHVLQPNGIVDLLFEKSLILKIFEIYTTAWRSSRNLLLVLLTPPLRCAPWNSGGANVMKWNHSRKISNTWFNDPLPSPPVAIFAVIYLCNFWRGYLKSSSQIQHKSNKNLKLRRNISDSLLDTSQREMIWKHKSRIYVLRSSGQRW